MWKYLSEGKINIVLQWMDTSHGTALAFFSPSDPLVHLLNKSVLVLKINKQLLHSILSTSSSSPDESSTHHVSSLQYIHFLNDYLQYIIGPLFQSSVVPLSSASSSILPSSPSCVDIGSLHVIPAQYIHDLLLQVAHHRPKHRKKAHAFDTSSSIPSSAMFPVLLLPNYTVSLPLPSPSSPLSTHSPVFCIELKPKCGILRQSQINYLPTSDQPTVDDQLRQHIKTRVCRFCMHQQHKLKHQEVEQISSFCPLDLYSCEHDRVEKAMSALLQCPQNNLRIFYRHIDSTVQVIDFSDVTHIRQLLEMMITPHACSQLLQQSDVASFVSFATTSISSLPLNVCHWLLQRFLSRLITSQSSVTSLFHRLQTLQHMFAHNTTSDPLLSSSPSLAPLPSTPALTPSIETVYAIFHHISQHATHIGISMEDWIGWKELWGWEDNRIKRNQEWMEDILQRLKLHIDSLNTTASPASDAYTSSDLLSSSHLCISHTTPQCESQSLNIPSHLLNLTPSPSSQFSHTSPTLPLTPSTLSSYLYCIRSFLLETTFKDCSLMITLRNNAADVVEDGFKYSVSSRLIDLEAKCAEKIPKYYQQDREIVEDYIESVKKRLAGEKANLKTSCTLV